MVKRSGGKSGKASGLDHKAIREHRILAYESDIKLYRLGFWLFFVLIIMSVGFSVWTISSIYSNYQVVTKILDESFDRTNLVLDITTSKITSCQESLRECRAARVEEPLSDVTG